MFFIYIFIIFLKKEKFSSWIHEMLFVAYNINENVEFIRAYAAIS